MLADADPESFLLRPLPGDLLALPAEMPRVVDPTPATHAVLAQLKAGETVFEADKLPKAV